MPEPREGVMRTIQTQVSDHDDGSDFPLVSIRIPEHLWHENEGVDPPHSRLLFQGALVINGLPLHLEAWEVAVVHDLQQHKAFPEDFYHLHAAVGAEGHFQTTIIRGREYIILASPHC